MTKQDIKFEFCDPSKCCICGRDFYNNIFDFKDGKDYCDKCGKKKQYKERTKSDE